MTACLSTGPYQGEFCGMCFRKGILSDATHKVEEEVFGANRHGLSQYLCCVCFCALMGSKCPDKASSYEDDDE